LRRGSAWATFADASTKKAPTVSPVSGGATAAGAVLQLEGRWFGAKRGKVYLDDGSGRLRALKIWSWSMDPETGTSAARVQLPSGVAGSFDVIVSSRVGNGTTELAIE
jgi:hypothetical protein